MAAAQSMPQDGRGKRVLVVDDEAVTLKVLDTALRKRGYEVVTAHSSEEALELRVHRGRGGDKHRLSPGKVLCPPQRERRTQRGATISARP